VLVATLAAGGSGIGLANLQADGILVPIPTVFALSDPGLTVGQPLTLAVSITNGSSSETVTLRSVRLPNGVPAHVHLLHTGYSLAGVDGARGWPLKVDVWPVDGAKVTPHQMPFVLLVFSADQPGAYVVGPVTVHGDIPGPLGLRFGVSQTYTQYLVLCPGVSVQVCDQAHVPGFHTFSPA
jgi:hypothetical protein